MERNSGYFSSVRSGFFSKVRFGPTPPGSSTLVEHVEHLATLSLRSARAGLPSPRLPGPSSSTPRPCSGPGSSQLDISWTRHIERGIHTARQNQRDRDRERTECEVESSACSSTTRPCSGPGSSPLDISWTKAYWVRDTYSQTETETETARERARARDRDRERNEREREIKVKAERHSLTRCRPSGSG